ncbi:MAG: 16S rRNA (guanine(966)-N(2))-methyltransferase RsmD [Clostridium sp.]|jgi:16S rRNA (guanine966-N2)-methyltransferase|nr:16S rRNA (guanine(966)-N(2))-methyltransferase RsmD [Clostridium sp.]
MRVIAGSAKSLPIKSPKGLRTRPTQDQMKETLFNLLKDEIQGAVFVDLFCGSGQIGIEALSRGAKQAFFVDQDISAIQCTRENLIFTKLIDRAIIKKQDFEAGLRSLTDQTIDILFMDPPYGKALENKVFSALHKLNAVDEHTLIIVETAIDTPAEELEQLGYILLREKRYKSNKHMFFQLNGVSSI